MNTTFTGKALVVGNNIDTDMIYPGRFLELTDPREIGSHCLAGISEDIAPSFPKGGILVAGTNFGCGSSREHAPLAIKSCGVKCVIAPSFARIFYRNSINIGLPILECPAASRGIESGDEVTVDYDTGIITNVTKNETYQAEPFPPFIKDMIARGGLMASLKAKEARA